MNFKTSYLSARSNRPFPSSKKSHFQNEAKCEAVDMKMIFNYYASKTHFHNKGFALSLVLKVRFFGTRNCPFCVFNNNPWVDLGMRMMTLLALLMHYLISFHNSYNIAVTYATYAAAKRKPEKNSGLYGIRTLDLSFQAFFSQLHKLRI